MVVWVHFQLESIFGGVEMSFGAESGCLFFADEFHISCSRTSIWIVKQSRDTQIGSENHLVQADTGRRNLEILMHVS